MSLPTKKTCRFKEKVVKYSRYICIIFLVSSALSTEGAEIYLENYGPSSTYRWLDAADQEYAESFQDSYSYDAASVKVVYNSSGSELCLHIEAQGLKPNFAYQVKLVGKEGTPENERIGMSGRWWEQEWTGTEWTDGWNLNNKGDGTYPNPNDDVYFQRRDIPDSSSPSGLRYRYTGYRVAGYFITDTEGAAQADICVSDSFHVLWKESQRAPETGDGDPAVSTFDPDPDAGAVYDTDYGDNTVNVYGEWERLPKGGVSLENGFYCVELLLTEESFHGSGKAGWWAHAMHKDIEFTITDGGSTENNEDDDGTLSAFIPGCGYVPCRGAEGNYLIFLLCAGMLFATMKYLRRGHTSL